MEQIPETQRMKLLGSFGGWAFQHWGRALLLALAITLVLGIGMSRVKTEFTFHSMLPQASPQVRELEKIEENFPIASAMVVVLEAQGPNAEVRVKGAVDALEAEFSRPRYSEQIARVQGKMDLGFFRRHGVLISEADDIQRMRRTFADLSLVPLLTRLNEDFEREYSGNEENLSDEEDQATARFEGLGELLALMEKAAAGESFSREQVSLSLDRFLFGAPYFLSRDNSRALLFIQPTFTINDIEETVTVISRLETEIKEKAKNLGTKAGLTGFLVVGKDEMVTSQQGLIGSMLIAVGLILTLLILTYRMFSVPFISGIPLLTGILWTVGLSGFVLGRLNIVTAMYMVALVGLGVDYAIHLLTTYIQERDEGKSLEEAIRESMRKSGAGILTGALTTSIAFFALVIARSEIVRELGLVAGMGILCELAAMFLLVPALLGLRTSWLRRRGREDSSLLRRLSPRYRFMPALGGRIKARPMLFLLITLALSALLATRAGKVEVEGNLMNMEAKGLESIELQDLMVEEFGMAPDVMSVTGTDLETVREMEDRIDELASVKTVGSLIPFFPSPAEQQERALLALQFQQDLAAGLSNSPINPEALREQLLRLEDNLLELSDLADLGGMDRMFYTLNGATGRNPQGEKIAETALDRLILLLEASSPTEATQVGSRLAALQEVTAPLLREKLLRMAGAEPVRLEMLPTYIRESYLSKAGDRYLLNVIPTQNPWVPEYRNVLTRQLASVTDRAAGYVLAADQMLQIARRDGVRAALAALLAIFLLLLLDFRNFSLALATLFPLLLSFVSLFGIMALAGIKFDFINIIAVPLLIGIGIDDAVHINHRYLLEGKGNIHRVISKTGRAVLMTSVTTIIGFASFIPSIMRAMRSTGIVLSLAMALAFLFSIVFHPALLLLLAEKVGLNLKPWKLKRRTR